jgi:hypothetical protein
MEKIFVILTFCLFYLNAGIYDHRNIKNISFSDFDIKVEKVLDNQDINVYVNNMKLATYFEDGGIPEVKEVFFNKETQYLVILVGWDAYHSAIDTKGDMYLLEVFRKNVKFERIDPYSKEGFEGTLEGVQTSFKYKSKENILKYLSNLNNQQRNILQNKQLLYSEPQIKTKMYLVKGDEVEILEEKDDWLYILYKGKKDIKAWIPKSAVEYK